jgi:hypothetical protein
MAEIKNIGEPYSSDEKELPVYDVSDIDNGIIIENVDDLNAA